MLVNQFIEGQECSLPLTEVKVGELYFDSSGDQILVYQKGENSNLLVQVVNNYGELYEIPAINIELSPRNYLILNP